MGGGGFCSSTCTDSRLSAVWSTPDCVLGARLSAQYLTLSMLVLTAN